VLALPGGGNREARWEKATREAESKGGEIENARKKAMPPSNRDGRCKWGIADDDVTKAGYERVSAL
jgi:hypothetical protein